MYRIWHIHGWLWQKQANILLRDSLRSTETSLTKCKIIIYKMYEVVMQKTNVIVQFHISSLHNSRLGAILLLSVPNLYLRIWFSGLWVWDQLCQQFLPNNFKFLWGIKELLSRHNVGAGDFASPSVTFTLKVRVSLCPAHC